MTKKKESQKSQKDKSEKKSVMTEWQKRNIEFLKKKEAEKVYNQLKHKYFEGNVNGDINIIFFSTLVENYTNERKNVIKKQHLRENKQKLIHTSYHILKTQFCIN